MKNIKKLNVAIAGFGVVGKKRKNAILNCKYLNLTAVSDVIFKNDFKSKNVSFFQDFNNLLDFNLDIIFICLPNKYAVPFQKKCLKKNINIFCEKPPAKNYKEFKSFYDFYNKYYKNKVLIKYGFNHRYHDSIVDALKMIKSNKLGKIINLRGVYGKSAIVSFDKGWRSKRSEAGGGILLDQGIHMLDLILFLTKKSYKVESSIISNQFWGHDIEDNAFITLSSKDIDKVIATVHSTATEWQHKFRLEINLQRGKIELSGILSGSKSYGKEKFIVTTKHKNQMISSNNLTQKSYQIDNSWQLEVNEFAEIVLNNKKVKIGNIEESLEVMKLINDSYTLDKAWSKKYK